MSHVYNTPPLRGEAKRLHDQKVAKQKELRYRRMNLKRSEQNGPALNALRKRYFYFVF